MKFVHMLPKVKSKNNILESLKKNRYPAQKVYVVLWENYDNESKSEDLEDTLRVLVEVDKIDVRQLDIDDILHQLLKIIYKELEEGNEVLINSTDSPEILNFTFHISAHLSDCKLYAGIPDKQGEGIEEVIDIPVIAPKRTDDHDLKIIKILHDHGGELRSIDDLVQLYELQNGHEEFLGDKLFSRL